MWIAVASAAAIAAAVGKWRHWKAINQRLMTHSRQGQSRGVAVWGEGGNKHICAGLVKLIMGMLSALAIKWSSGTQPPPLKPAPSPTTSLSSSPKWNWNIKYLSNARKITSSFACAHKMLNKRAIYQHPKSMLQNVWEITTKRNKRSNRNNNIDNNSYSTHVQFVKHTHTPAELCPSRAWAWARV